MTTNVLTGPVSSGATDDPIRENSHTGWTNPWGQDKPIASGTAQIQIANLRGDIVAQIPNVPGAFGGFSSYAETTEYGLDRVTGVKVGQNYGWLGTERRSSDSLGGLTLMGARLYNPMTGRFLSRDPILGGNDNTYIYPTDPVNNSDTSGCRACKKGAKDFDKAPTKRYELDKNWRSAAKTLTKISDVISTVKSWFDWAIGIAVDFKAMRQKNSYDYLTYKSCRSGVKWTFTYKYTRVYYQGQYEVSAGKGPFVRVKLWKGWVNHPFSGTESKAPIITPSIGW